MTTIAEALAESVTCPWCGGKMWPAAQLEAHMLRHELKQIRYLHLLGEVQTSFRRMRDVPAWNQEAA